MSTAEMAHATKPGRPRFRHARAIRSFIPGTSRGTEPTQMSDSLSLTTVALPAPAYVQPSPDCSPARISTTTVVVEDHSRVPSASG